MIISLRDTTLNGNRFIDNSFSRLILAEKG